MTTYAYPARTKTNSQDLNSTQNIAHPEWELRDPTPDINKLFHTFNNKFFRGALTTVELEWSKKMYQCAGICYMRKSGGHMACTIRLSEPLLKLRSRKELIETLLHEMIHAWNFVLGIYEENGGHGKNFKAKMEEINKVAGTNITVYHTFHDEVELYKKHWWRCEGPCRDRRPYFGYVKRVSNRAPGKNDTWWNQHQSSCGGNFIKIKEPEKKAKTERKKKETVKKEATKKTAGKSNDIRKYFPNTSQSSQSDFDDDDENIKTDDKGFVIPKSASPIKSSGKVLGGSGGGRSRLLDGAGTSKGTVSGGKVVGGIGTGRSKLLDLYPPQQQPSKKIKLESETIEIKDSPKTPRKSFSQKVLEEIDDDDIILLDDEFDDALGDAFSGTIDDKPKQTDNCHCPICNQSMKIEEINSHLDECLTLQMLN